MTNIKRTRVLAQKRREAAASITWPANTPFLVNPEPIVRKNLEKVAIVLATWASLWAILQTGILDQWARSMDNDKLRPKVEVAMKAGSHTAAVWLATHYYKEYPGLMEKEAETGEPTAMFLIGRYLVLNEGSSDAERARGHALLSKAIAAGNQDALLFAVKHDIAVHDKSGKAGT